ncbi:hypothetical protein RhiirC2_709772, partial [Rhizophagus irregularis]
RNYLIKEEESIGKGANAVISFVHNYFRFYGLGETKLVIHADNCAGQNKNNAMIMYLAWRIACGLHTQITYSFMVAGHTKFSPDGFFGLLKLKLRKSEVDNLDDLIEVVETSTTGGKVDIKEAIDSDSQIINIMKKDVKIEGFPWKIVSTGLSPERKWYLYEQVRQNIGNPQK